MRTCEKENFINEDALTSIGLDSSIIASAIDQTYLLLDKIDATLIAAGVFPLSETVELANLSSMIGNVFASALAQHSGNTLRRNGPHKYPDLLAVDATGSVPDIEVKVALEKNQPKGHLAKEGQYLTCRYVLCAEDGIYGGFGSRGVVPFVWEIRSGHLLSEHFNISNTAGDSGKTAVVNAAGMEALKIVYLDLHRSPLGRTGKTFKSLARMMDLSFD